MAAIPTVAVYVTADRIYVISQQMTDHGRVSVEPMLRLEADAAAAAVGEAVLQCLDAFREIDGPPQSGHVEGLLGFVDARSWQHFARRAINVSVEGRSRDRAALAAARSDGRGAYAYGAPQECRREPLAVGELLCSMVDGIR